MKETENKNKIYFRDLSIPLKIAIVGSYIIGILGASSFVIGFILGVAGA